MERGGSSGSREPGLTGKHAFTGLKRGGSRLQLFFLTIFLSTGIAGKKRKYIFAKLFENSAYRQFWQELVR
jgi:hypothetical protein